MDMLVICLVSSSLTPLINSVSHCMEYTGLSDA